MKFARMMSDDCAYVADIGFSGTRSSAPIRKRRNARQAEPEMRMGRRPSSDMTGQARMVPMKPMMVR